MASGSENASEAIKKLGEGWVGEEALAIALYCALKKSDVKEALILSVNHDGDCDSTGAICGNILGAAYEMSALPEAWIANIELKELLTDLGHRLFEVLEYDLAKEHRSIKHYSIREIKQTEIPLLSDFLYEAIYQWDDHNRLPRYVIEQPELQVYIENFGRKDDHCLVAECDGKIVGAVWTRIMAANVQGFGNADDKTPKFAISLYPEYRNRGIGTAQLIKFKYGGSIMTRIGMIGGFGPESTLIITGCKFRRRRRILQTYFKMEKCRS